MRLFANKFATGSKSYVSILDRTRQLSGSVIEEYSNLATRDGLLTSCVDPLIHTIQKNQPIVSYFVASGYLDHDTEGCLKIAREYEETAKRVEHGLYELKEKEQTIHELSNSVVTLERDFKNAEIRFLKKMRKDLAKHYARYGRSVVRGSDSPTQVFYF